MDHRDYSRIAHEEDWRRAGERKVTGMPASMKALGDLVPQALRPYDDRKDDIRTAASSAQLQWDCAVMDFRSRRSAEGFGPDRVERDAAAVAATCARLRSFCESPIEHQMVPWLVCQNYGQWKCGAPVVHVPREDLVPPDAELMIIPQFAFARFRLDFAVVAKLKQHVKIIAIECDGREFHDPQKDFRRDLYLLGWNIPTVRATGSEIARNPKHVGEMVARYILDWACDLGLRP